MERVCKKCQASKDLETGFPPKSWVCRDCRAENTARWYQANKVRALAARSAYYISHKQKISEYKRRYYEEHKGELSEYQKEHYANNSSSRKLSSLLYKKTHPDVVAVHGHKRRALAANSSGSYTVEEWVELKTFYGNRCLCCGLPEKQAALTVDHVIPLSCGGTNDIGNIQPLCKACNCSKYTGSLDYRNGPYSKTCADFLPISFTGVQVVGEASSLAAAPVSS